jgi:hypothetical protein
MSALDWFAEQARIADEHRAQIADLSEHEHVFHQVDFGAEGDAYDQFCDANPDITQDEIESAQQARKEVEPDRANAISSALVEEGKSWRDRRHTIALDIDHRVRVVPSSTEGHSHLYIDVPLEWEQYEKLLKVLAEIGVVEEGYVGASIRRRATHLRLPWVRKEEPADLPPVTPVPMIPVEDLF